MKRRLSRLVLGALLAAALGSNAAWAHPVEIGGLVLTVVPERREIVVRRDAPSGVPALTTLYRLAAGIDISALHAGERIVARVDERQDALLDEIRIVPAESIIRIVHPLSAGDTMPADRFIDQNGHVFDFADFRGKSVVLAFIYTRCRDPKECPLVSANFHTLQQRFGNGPYHLVEITLEPAFDRPNVLARYGAQFDANPARWSLGTGDPNAVLDFDARFGLDPFADPRVGLIHTERTVLIDPHGKIIDFIDQAAWNPLDLYARLQAANGREANPLARLDFELSKVAVAVCGNRVAGFSGLQDLAIVLVIVGAGAFALQFLARKIFAAHA